MIYLGNQSVGVNSPQNVTDVQVNGVSVLNDGVANVPLATGHTFGVVKTSTNQGIGIDSVNKNLMVFNATSSLIKAGANAYKPITPSNQDVASFYGLAKAAGADMASSSNPVGTYTDEAKIAIQKMLGIYREWELIANVTVSEDSAQFAIDTDINGQAFTLSKMLVRVWLQPSTTGTADFMTATNLALDTLSQNITSSSPTLKYMTNGANTFMEYVSEIMGGTIYAMGTATSVPGSTGAVNKISSVSDTFYCIRGFRMSQYSTTTSLVPAGTVIKIYGIRI